MSSYGRVSRSLVFTICIDCERYWAASQTWRLFEQGVCDIVSSQLYNSIFWASVIILVEASVCTTRLSYLQIWRIQHAPVIVLSSTPFLRREHCQFYSYSTPPARALRGFLLQTLRCTLAFRVYRHTSSTNLGIPIIWECACGSSDTGSRSSPTLSSALSPFGLLRTGSCCGSSGG